MLEVKFKNKKNPYDTTLDVLRSLNSQSVGRVEVNYDGVSFSGELPKKFIETMDINNISTITNYEMVEESTNLKEVNPKDVYMVDFGKSYRNEFSGLHPAIVCFSAGDDLWNVIPVTSKRWKDKEVSILRFADPKVLKNANEFFVNRAVGVTAYVLFNERRAVSKGRFRYYLGRLDDDVFEGITQKANNYVLKEQNCLESTITSEANSKKKTENDSINDFSALGFSKAQESLINASNKARILSICNSSTKSEKEKAIDILKVFKIDPKATFVNECILKLIIEAKGAEEITLKESVKKYAHGKGITENELSRRITNLIGKRLNGTGSYYVSAESFICFISKLAYRRTKE